MSAQPTILSGSGRELRVSLIPRSGALITASWALEQGRPAYLVPGRLTDGTYAGSLAFLREFIGEAKIVAGIPQLIADLGYADPAHVAQAADAVAAVVRTGIRNRWFRPGRREDVAFEVLPEERAVQALVDDAAGRLAAVDEGSVRNGIVPPTGFVCFLPRRNVVFLDMNIEDAAKVIISAGMVTPESQAKLRDLAEQARRKPKITTGPAA